MQLGRYEVVRKLGEGGMARVLLAKSATGENVVLKVPFTLNADFAERVRDEARVGLRLNHPSVVDTLDLFEHEGKPILVVEYVEGASLQQLRRHAGAMPPGLVARIGRQVAEGLAFIHEATDENDQPLQILHRDVAPGNILVTREGNAKLIDLGIARGAETKAKKTQVGTVRGTMRYLAPELLAGERHTPATDLWALGVVLFEAALGRRAAEGDERDVLATIVRGDIAKLREGERIEDALGDGLFALLAPRDRRLQRARAAVNVLKRIEEALPVDEAWAQEAVSGVLARMHERWAAEGTGLADAATVARPLSAEAEGAAEGEGRDQPTAVTMPSVVEEHEPVASPAASAAPANDGSGAHRTTVTDPRPRVAPDQELGHADGVAPTVRMEAAELMSLEPGAPTELMPAVDPLPSPTADTRVAERPRGFEQTQKFPKPGPAHAPAASDDGGSSLAWRSVAAPTLLGLTATEVAPQTPGPAAPPAPSTSPSPSAAPSPSSLEPSAPAFPRTLDQPRSEPVIAAEPDEKTEAGAPPPRPPSALGPPLQQPSERSGPLPRMLRVEEAFRNDTDLAQPIVYLPTQGEAAATPQAAQPAQAAPKSAAGEPAGSPAPASPKPLDPSHRPPDPRALGIPTPMPLEAARAATEPPGPPVTPEEPTETAFEHGVPDTLPRAPVVVRPASAPPPAAEPAPPPAAQPAPAPPVAVPARAPGFENSDRTMRMPPAPRAGFVGQRANPDDATERVARWARPGSDDAAAGFEEPLLSGELDWRPNRKKHLAIAAAVAVAFAVATVVVLVLLG